MSGQTRLTRAIEGWGGGGQQGGGTLPLHPPSMFLTWLRFLSRIHPIRLNPLAIPHEGGCSLTQEPRGAGLHDAILGRLEDGLGQRDGVTHHGTVEPILSHHAAPAPALLPLPPLGPAVLEPNLGEGRNKEKYGFWWGAGVSVPFPHGNTRVLVQRDEGRRIDAHPKSTVTSSPMQQPLGISPSLPCRSGEGQA